MLSMKNAKHECDLKVCKAWCCKQFWVLIEEELDPDMKRYLELHGVKVNGKRLTIPLKCQELSPKNECLIYKYRPDFCKEFWCKDPKNSELM